jgi:hypothetical protein
MCGTEPRASASGLEAIREATGKTRMDGLLELGGVWLARAYALYGVFLLLPAFFFIDLLLLAAVVRVAAGRSRKRQPWAYVPVSVRRRIRLAVELAFGLIHPVLYLAILAPSLPGLRSGAEWWRAPLQASAWILLTAFWSLRMFGAALDPRSRACSRSPSRMPGC